MKNHANLSYEQYLEKIKTFYETFENECLKENASLREVYTLEVIFDKFYSRSSRPEEYEKYYVFDTIKGKNGVYEFIQNYCRYIPLEGVEADVSFLVKKYFLTDKVENNMLKRGCECLCHIVTPKSNYEELNSVLFDGDGKITDVKFPHGVEKVLEHNYQELMPVYEEYISLSFSNLFYEKADIYSVKLKYSPGTRLKIQLSNGSIREYVVLCNEDENGIDSLLGVSVSIFDDIYITHLSRLSDYYGEMASFLIPLLKPIGSLKNKKLNKIAELIQDGTINGKEIIRLHRKSNRMGMDEVNCIFDEYLSQNKNKEDDYPLRLDIDGYKKFYNRAKANFLSLFSNASDNAIYVAEIKNDKAFENKYEIFPTFDKVKEYAEKTLLSPVSENAYLVISRKLKTENNDFITTMLCIMQKDLSVSSFSACDGFEYESAFEIASTREFCAIAYDLCCQTFLPELVMTDDANSGDVYYIDIPNEGREYVIYLGMIKQEWCDISEPLFLAKKSYSDGRYYVDDLRGSRLSAGLNNECRHLLKKVCVESLKDESIDDILIKASEILAKDKDGTIANKIVEISDGIWREEDLIKQLVLEYYSDENKG